MREKSFIRIKESFNTNEIKERQYSKISIITFKDYLQKTNYKAYGYGIKPYPYKWWQVWYLIEVPAFYLWLLLFKNSRWKDFKATHIATKVAIVLIEASITFFFTKYLLEKIF